MEIRDRWFVRVYWPAHLAKSVCSGFSERLCLKIQEGGPGIVLYTFNLST